MKKLCIDARMLHASGIGTYLQNLLPYFDKHYRLLLLGEKTSLSGLPLSNAEIIPLSAPIYSISEQYQVPLKVPSCDLFWSPHYNSPILPVKAKKRIVTIHDVFHLKFFHTLSLSQKIYAKIFLKSAAHNSNTIITVSHFSKKELIRYLRIREEKIHVIHNGVSSLYHVINEPGALRQKHLLPKKYILFVGNVKPHKNISHLVKAFENLKKDPAFREYKLVIVGKRKGLITAVQNLELLIKNSKLEPEVIFLEDVPSKDLPVIYNMAQLLVFPSFYEGFGLPPLEAMSCGCPTVVSDIECLREIYENKSMYVSPEDPESIKNGIYRALTDESLRKSLIEGGKEHAKKFNWESSANKHLHIFEKTLRSK